MDQDSQKVTILTATRVIKYAVAIVPGVRYHPAMPRNRTLNYSLRPCEICGAMWEPKDRYQATRNTTCSKECSNRKLARNRRGKGKKPSELRRLTKVACAVCGQEVLRQNCHLKRVKKPTCSRRCNGMLRGQDWKQHAHKAARARTAQGRASYRKKMSGPSNPAWKGGVTYRHRKGNYVQVRYVRAPKWAKLMARKDGYVMEHRLVMAKRIGRTLLRVETVHHLDHRPLNNEDSNLELWPDNRSHKLAEHGRFAEGAVCRVFWPG